MNNSQRPTGLSSQLPRFLGVGLFGSWKLTAIAIVAAVVSGCDVQVSEKGLSLDLAEGKATDEWKRTYTLAKGGTLEIHNESGRINVVQTANATVDVSARRTVRGAASDEAAADVLKSMSVVEEVSADRVVIKYTDATFTGPFGHRRGIGAEIDVRVPAGLTLVLQTQSGPVSLLDVNARVRATSTNGGVTARSMSGALEARSVNGPVVADFASVSGEVTLVTVNGSVRLELPQDVDADFEGTAVNGTVTVDEQLPLQATVRERVRVAGRLNDGGPKIVAQTTNGPVRVSVRGQRR